METAIDRRIQRFGRGIVMRARGFRQGGTAAAALDFLDRRDGGRLAAPPR